MQKSDTPDSNHSPATRVLSIDALRGFDMFWIVGGDLFFQTLFRLWPESPFAKSLLEQLEHADWEGFRFYDLIFPLFLFLVGCSLPFSLDKYRSSPMAVYGRIARRTVLLVVIGLIYNRMLDFQWDQLRFCGVLQRIGICYGLSALLYVTVTKRGWLIGIAGAILVLYWGLLAWIPTPVSSLGYLSKEGNLSGFIDRSVLPGKILSQYYGYGDNEGLLSTLPAVVTCLLGVLGGTILKGTSSERHKLFGLLCVGAGCLASGLVWSLWFPIIKNLWTSSFVLVAGGWSFLLLAFFYFWIDVVGWKKWAFVWVVIGTNAITIYLIRRVIKFSEISAFFLTGVSSYSGDYKSLVLVFGTLLLEWSLLLFLYRKKIFLRL